MTVPTRAPLRRGDRFERVARVEEGSPGTDARDTPDDVTLDGRAEEPDEGWPGPIEEPPPLFAS